MKISQIIFAFACLGCLSSASAQTQISVSQVRPMEYETFFFSFNEGKSAVVLELKTNRLAFDSFSHILTANRKRVENGEFKIALRSYDPKNKLARTRALKTKSYLIKALGLREKDFSTLVTDSPMDSAEKGVTVGLIPANK